MRGGSGKRVEEGDEAIFGRVGVDGLAVAWARDAIEDMREAMAGDDAPEKVVRACAHDNACR